MPPVNAQSCFPFQPIDDTIVEFTENILLTASSDNPDVQFTGVGGNMATINIIDNNCKSMLDSTKSPLKCGHPLIQ